MVPARNEEAYIGACLAAIFSQSPPPDEVIVVDNASSDQTADLARRMGARVIRVETPGVHLARQAGLSAAKSPVVAFTDADSQPLSGWIKAIRAAFQDPSVVISYGPVEFYEAPPLDTLLARYGFPLFLSLLAKLGHPNPAGANMAVARSKALEVGGFDRPFAEDIHLALKLKDRGRLVYRPDQRVRTSGRRLKKGRWRMYALHAKNVYRRLRGLPEDYGNDYFADREKGSSR